MNSFSKARRKIRTNKYIHAISRSFKHKHARGNESEIEGSGEPSDVEKIYKKGIPKQPKYKQNFNASSHPHLMKTVNSLHKKKNKKKK